jgi:hypothetical protein
MSLITELESVVSFIQYCDPTATIERQNVPLTPQSGTYVIRYQSDNRKLETASHSVITREWQIVYFSNNIQDCLNVVDNLASYSFNKRLLIPIQDTLKYMRIQHLTFGQPFWNESSMNVLVGVLTTQTREAIDQGELAKIQSVSTVIIP